MSHPRTHAATSALDQALGRFERHIGHAMASFARTNPGLDSEDLIQDVRIRLWRALEREPRADITAPYVQKTIASVAIDHIRSLQSRPSTSLDVLLEKDHVASTVDLTTKDQSPEQQAHTRQQLEQAAICLTRLSPRRAAAVGLFAQGYRDAEVGQALGIKPDAARKLVTRGLDDFHSAWAQEQQNPSLSHDELQALTATRPMALGKRRRQSENPQHDPHRPRPC